MLVATSANSGQGVAEKELFCSSFHNVDSVFVHYVVAEVTQKV